MGKNTQAFQQGENRHHPVLSFHLRKNDHFPTGQTSNGDPRIAQYDGEKVIVPSFLPMPQGLPGKPGICGAYHRKSPGSRYERQYLHTHCPQPERVVSGEVDAGVKRG